MADKFRGLRADLFAQPSGGRCEHCGAREGHYVTCPDLGKPDGAREPEVCPQCHLEHAGDCF
jgi:hypothetical protein